MKIATRDFGELEINETQLLHFVQPVFGFEELTRFAMLCDDDLGTDIAWLQSVEDSSVCFIMMNSLNLMPTYKPEISAQLRQQLENTADKDLSYWSILVIPENIQNATANLKSPILINIKNNFAAQIILDADYPIKHPIYSAKGGA